MCSSSVLTKFIPVFILSNILLSFVVPTVLVVLLYGSSKSERLKVTCMSFLPPILFPTDPASKQLFSPHVIMSKMFHHIALLLTFGVACPPLAVGILLTVCLTSFTWELLVGRYIAHSREVADISLSDASRVVESSHSQATNNTCTSSISIPDELNIKGKCLHHREFVVLNSLCDGVWRCPQTSIWVIIDATACFSALFVFDISGDDSGWLVASVAFSLPMLCVPVVLRLIFKWWWVAFADIGKSVDKKNEAQVLSEQITPLPIHDL
jgi:hypothetical protein